MCDKTALRLLQRERGRCRLCGGVCPSKKDLCLSCAEAYTPLKYTEE